MSDDRKDLPPVTAPNFNERLRETISTYLGNRGNKLDRGVTLRDLVGSGLVTLRESFLSGNGGGASPISGVGAAITGAYEPDLTPPPTPEGFTASAAISNIFIEHAAPLYPQGHGHGRTIVYGATWTSGALPTFTNAVKITEFTGTVFAHPTNPATTWHLWIKWQSADGVLSAAPAGGTNGLAVTTGQDVSLLVKAMTGPGNPFTVLAVDTIINGVTFPAGTYSTKAFIQDLQVTTAKIANLAVDDAKIASLSVSKLDAGSLKVGSYISSANYLAGSQGFAVWANGLAEFNNVVVRGGVYASYGSFTGNVNADSGYFRGSVNTGSYQGYAWPAIGGGAHLSADGLLVGNANTGKYFQLTSDGNLYAPQFTIVNGAANFGGALLAATGTFAGALSAATGSFAGSLSAATGSFSGSLSAASGTFSGTLTADAINAVNTLNIAGSAVTVPVFAASNSAASVIFINSTVLATTAVDIGTGAVVVTFTCSSSVKGSGSNNTLSWAIVGLYRDGVLLVEQEASSGLSGVTVVDYPGYAATYNLKARSNSGTVSQDIYYRTITALGCKR